MKNAAILFFDNCESFEPASENTLQVLQAQCGIFHKIESRASLEQAMRAKSMRDAEVILTCANTHIYPENYVESVAARHAESGYACAGLDGEVFPDLYDGLEDTVCRLPAAEGGLEVNALGIGGMIMSPACREALAKLPDSFFEDGWRYAGWLLAERLEALGHRRWLLKVDDPRKPVRGAASEPRRVTPPAMVRSIHIFGGMRRLALPPITA